MSIISPKAIVNNLKRAYKHYITIKTLSGKHYYIKITISLHVRRVNIGNIGSRGQ
jgi:hypothetical protein